jgi:prepilin-type N-terminal cleavage/methylation domain-containing protein
VAAGANRCSTGVAAGANGRTHARPTPDVVPDPFRKDHANGRTHARPTPDRLSNPKSKIQNPKSPRRGVTLIELMVVVSIMLMVTVIAIPALKPALENRKIREAARSLNVYLGSARNHAIELGRPVGVLFTRDSTQGNPCLTLQQVEIPSPYAGDVANATASVYATSTGGGGFTYYTLTITFNPAATALFHVGDYIQFGYQGTLYYIAGVNSSGTTISSATATLTVPAGCSIPWPTAAPGVMVPFQITRMPDFTGGVTLATQSVVAPMQLPAGTAIDLRSSGTNTGLWFGVNTPTLTPNVAMLIFSPAGGVYGVFANGAQSGVVDPVYFLIGRRDRVFNVNLGSNVTIPQVSAMTGDVLPADGLANWQDSNNLWVTVTPQTGRITTVENAAINTVNTPNLLSTTNANAIVLARGFALQGQSKGGR